MAWANGWIPWFGTNFGERTDVWLGRGAGFMVLGLIMLSLVPLIGWAGQVSFANFAIAGFGARHVLATSAGRTANPIGHRCCVIADVRAARCRDRAPGAPR